MAEPTKCPDCGAEVSQEATSNLRGCWPKGKPCEVVRWGCGRRSDDLKAKVVGCLERQLAARDTRIGELEAAEESHKNTMAAVERTLAPEWEAAREAVFASNNYGWNMVVDEIVLDMRRRLIDGAKAELLLGQAEEFARTEGVARSLAESVEEDARTG
jgi:hypothetical protein